LQRRFSKGVTHLRNAVSVVRKIASGQFRRWLRARRRVREHPATAP
jgi:hypothetical protein